jgi:hypothetical protein
MREHATVREEPQRQLAEAPRRTARHRPRRDDKVEEALDELALCGPQLGRPLADRVHGSKIHDLKELRPRVPGGAEVRVLFVFDAEREAIVLVAGDKAGRWRTWYAEAIPLAQERYAAYRREADEDDE